MKYAAAIGCAFMIGLLCRRFGIECPAPPTIKGALMVAARVYALIALPVGLLLAVPAIDNGTCIFRHRKGGCQIVYTKSDGRTTEWGASFCEKCEEPLTGFPISINGESLWRSK
jgi:XapX domain-containing protein